VPHSVDLKEALAHLRAAPGPMARLIDVHGAPELRRTRNAFQSLGRAIVYQQLSGKAAGTIYGRFLKLCPGGRFPKPDVLASMNHSELRSAGLSNAKASYLLDLAAHFDDGRITTRRFNRMSNDEIREALIKVKGVGPWSVDMFLMFGLNRPDVLPVGDLGVQGGMQTYFGLRSLPKPVRMHELAESWQPHRTVASWYMWRVRENGLPPRAKPARGRR
jgi:DNA-3-methyladenine glycosylase II